MNTELDATHDDELTDLFDRVTIRHTEQGLERGAVIAGQLYSWSVWAPVNVIYHLPRAADKARDSYCIRPTNRHFSLSLYRVFQSFVEIFAHGVDVIL